MSPTQQSLYYSLGDASVPQCLSASVSQCPGPFSGVGAIPQHRCKTCKGFSSQPSCKTCHQHSRAYAIASVPQCLSASVPQCLRASVPQCLGPFSGVGTIPQHSCKTCHQHSRADAIAAMMPQCLGALGLLLSPPPPPFYYMTLRYNALDW